MELWSFSISVNENRKFFRCNYIFLCALSEFLGGWTDAVDKYFLDYVSGLVSLLQILSVLLTKVLLMKLMTIWTIIYCRIELIVWIEDGSLLLIDIYVMHGWHKAALCLEIRLRWPSGEFQWAGHKWQTIQTNKFGLKTIYRDKNILAYNL